MMRFAKRNIVPPGNRYFFTVPETDTYFEHPDFAKLELLVRNHYYSNNLPIPEYLPAKIEHHMCLNLPESFCEGLPEAQEQRARVLTFWIIADNTARLTVPGAGFVSAEEAERRAAICVRCPNNMAGICSSCSGLKMRFAAQTRGRSTLQDRYLGACSVDGTLTTVKVLVPLVDAQRVHKSQTVFENTKGIRPFEECWINEKTC